MGNTIVFFIGCLISCASVQMPEQPRVLKGDGHLLGETAEQFFSEGIAGDMLRACQKNDWKTVSRLSANADQASKPKAKDECATAKLARQQATSGKRVEYSSRGDRETLRADTFTFDGGHLVKIEMVYTVPIANIEGFHSKSFGELFAGLQEAYGPPSKSSIEPKVNAYGVKYDAHRAVWLGKEDVISIVEHPGENGRSEIVAETVAEYARAGRVPKAANPLQ
jgi:hypothetical protein